MALNYDPSILAPHIAGIIGMQHWHMATFLFFEAHPSQKDQTEA
jgi:hypothetical protein